MILTSLCSLVCCSAGSLSCGSFQSCTATISLVCYLSSGRSRVRLTNCWTDHKGEASPPHRTTFILRQLQPGHQSSPRKNFSQVHNSLKFPSIKICRSSMLFVTMERHLSRPVWLDLNTTTIGVDFVEATVDISDSFEAVLHYVILFSLISEFPRVPACHQRNITGQLVSAEPGPAALSRHSRVFSAGQSAENPVTAN